MDKSKCFLSSALEKRLASGREALKLKFPNSPLPDIDESRDDGKVKTVFDRLVIRS